MTERGVRPPTPTPREQAAPDDHSSSGARRRWPDWAGLAARLVLGVTLLVAGLIKITAVGATIQSVRAYRIVSWDLAPAIGYALPVLEILVGLALTAGLLTRWSALLATLAMAVFVVAIFSAWARGLRLDCGCFGSGGLVGDPWDEVRGRYIRDILRDVGLMVPGIWLVVRPRTALSVDGWMAPDLH